MNGTRLAITVLPTAYLRTLDYMARQKVGRGAKLPRLRLLRERAALTQAELSACASLSPSVVARLEANPDTKHADFKSVRALADALGVQPRDLMSE